MYIFMKSFSETWPPQLGIGIANSIFRLALNAFWKRALPMYVCMYIMLYIHIKHIHLN